MYRREEKIEHQSRVRNIEKMSSIGEEMLSIREEMWPTREEICMGSNYHTLYIDLGVQYSRDECHDALSSSVGLWAISPVIWMACFYSWPSRTTISIFTLQVYSPQKFLMCVLVVKRKCPLVSTNFSFYYAGCTSKY